MAGAGPTAPTRRRNILQTLRDWLRDGYPEEVPRHGYSPLIALCGPMSLTARQRRNIIEQLHHQRRDHLSIAVAITHVTGQLPTPGQTRAIEHALRDLPPSR